MSNVKESKVGGVETENVEVIESNKVSGAVSEEEVKKQKKPKPNNKKLREGKFNENLTHEMLKE